MDAWDVTELRALGVEFQLAVLDIGQWSGRDTLLDALSLLNARGSTDWNDPPHHIPSHTLTLTGSRPKQVEILTTRCRLLSASQHT